jgi:hypothetical protein
VGSSRKSSKQVSSNKIGARNYRPRETKIKSVDLFGDLCGERNWKEARQMVTRLDLFLSIDAGHSDRKQLQSLKAYVGFSELLSIQGVR